MAHPARPLKHDPATTLVPCPHTSPLYLLSLSEALQDAAATPFPPGVGQGRAELAVMR
jgi:hypothetical protein